MGKGIGRANARTMTCPPLLNRHKHHRHPEERALTRVSKDGVGTCGPSFEARREERRAPQDDGRVYGWWARRKGAFAHPTAPALREDRLIAVAALHRPDRHQEKLQDAERRMGDRID